ncbi:hypothetical protein [Alienimonas chondri]|uniref:Uncharacterized protein n=1 Tax=Alienimonas chondri TaxID=2681879 RepID=A0ABX1VHB4_9PLAN|nr:hypothetical protein [Alienimonas chondri]NNJ27476.1 hypothetical protein [Alienimonas chondri]
MNTHRIINQDSAREYFRQAGTDDPVLKTIVGRAYMRLLKAYYHSIDHRLEADLDLRFVAEVLVDLFKDRDVMKRILEGERPGAWDDD